MDCGGSKSCWEWRGSGSAVGAAAGGLAVPVQPAVQGIDAAGEALARVLLAATTGPDGQPQVTAAVAAVAGVADRASSAALVAAVRARSLQLPLVVVGDVLAAAAGALAADSGLLVWAGTGSFAIARAADGRLHRVGGRGYLLGDQGSGYDLVRRAAAAAVMAADGLAEQTALGEALAAAFDAAAPARLGAALQQLESGAVAARLPVVLECAAGGDLVAQAVLEEGMDALAMLANAATRQAALDWPDLSVTLGGGLLVGFDGVTALLRQRLAALGALPPSIADPALAARGAARLAQAWHSRQGPMADWVDDVSV